MKPKIRNATIAVLASLAALFTAPARSADALPDAANAADTQALGKRVYDHWCLPCHGRAPGRYGDGQPGTVAIRIKYEGQVPPVLEDRTDLTPDAVAVFVRHGANTMPFFRRTEISDLELAAIGAYLARNTPRTPTPSK